MTKETAEKNIEQTQDKSRINYVFIGLSILIGMYLNFDVSQLMILVAITFLLLYPLSSRTFARISVGLILGVIFFLLLGNKQKAEDVMVLAYLSLIFTGVQMIFDYFISSNRNNL